MLLPLVLVLVFAAFGLIRRDAAMLMPEPSVRNLLPAKDLVTVYDSLWVQFKEAFSKTYPSEEVEGVARRNFYKNLAHIAHARRLFDAGQMTYVQSVNSFSDVGADSPSLNLKLSLARVRAGSAEERTKFYVFKKLKARLAFPEEFDWRLYNVATEVRDQGDCGSCWAFAVSGALEGVYAFFNHENVQFSPQELVDCSLKNFGCEGGWIDVAFEYIAGTPGKWLSAETAYPYTGISSEPCRNVTSWNFSAKYELSCVFQNSKIFFKGGHHIMPGDEDAIEEALVLSGPVPAAVHATPNLFRYSTGIFDDATCGSRFLNHAVLIVGYGQSGESKYWVVKNSWGPIWGESGYFKLKRGVNMCGIAALAYTPLYTYKQKETFYAN